MMRWQRERDVGALVDLLVELDRRALVAGRDAAVDPRVLARSRRSRRLTSCAASSTLGMQTSMGRQVLRYMR